MSNVTVIHQYELCKDCGCGSFHICWPLGDKEDTYIRCANCKSEFNVTVKITKERKIEQT